MRLCPWIRPCRCQIKDFSDHALPLLLPADSIKLCSAHAGGAQVRLDGVDIRELSLMWFRSQFALVSQCALSPCLFLLTNLY